MTGPGADSPQWAMVDEGWGRKAVDFATLSEPGNCREYVALHHMLGVDNGDRLLDVACGAGLAIELASVRGADCAGIDASPRLVAVARDRSPRADIRVGDMHALPWDDGGLTCECGLAPLCRRHHQIKQAQGWKLEQPEPGIMKWTTPAGLTRTTTPTRYQD